MERIKSEIKNLIDEWRWHCSAEAKYRCEAYGELLEFINSLQEEPESEDLEEAAKKAGQKYFPDENNVWARPNYEAMATENAFKEGVKWGMEQAEVKIQAQSIAVAHGCPKEPVSEELEEAANDYAHDLVHDDVFENFIAGAKWQKEQMEKEVDLEKEFDDYTKDILACDIQFEPFTHLHKCAKHFFELGLKAQKGE